MAFRIYVEGEKNKCYTCVHLKLVHGGVADYCKSKNKYLKRDSERGCKSAWSRDYETVC